MATHPELKGHKVLINFLTEGEEEFRTIQSFVDSNREAERLRMFKLRGKGLKGLDAMSVNLGTSKSSSHASRGGEASVDQGEFSAASVSEAVEKTDLTVTTQIKSSLAALEKCYSKQLRAAYLVVARAWEQELEAQVDFTRALKWVLIPNMETERQALANAAQEGTQHRTWEPRSSPLPSSSTALPSTSPGLNATLHTHAADLGAKKAALQRSFDASRERAKQDRVVFERKQKALDFAAARTSDIKALSGREEAIQALEEAARRSGEECVLTGLRLVREHEIAEKNWISEALSALLKFA
jgi:hypothetical protein